MKAIVLKSIPHKDSDLILSLIASDGSLINVIARGAKKSKKRFSGGVLEPSHYIQFSVGNSRGELQTLSEASLLEDFYDLRKDYDKLQIASDFLSLTLKCCKENLENPELFHLLGNSLKTLCKLEDVKSISLHFRVRLLAILGLAPELEEIQIFSQLPISKNMEIKIPPKILGGIEREINFELKRFLEL